MAKKYIVFRDDIKNNLTDGGTQLPLSAEMGKSLKTQVDTKQATINSSNKLNSDLVNDNDQTNKFVSATEKAQITTNETNIATISGKISSQATSSNKVLSESEIDDKIALVEANQLYKTNAQGSFATKSELTSATTFYNADGTEATPTKNDIAYVLADETHEGKSAKYVIASITNNTITWGFVIAFTDTKFNTAQMNAINSGITSGKVATYDAYENNKQATLQYTTMPTASSSLIGKVYQYIGTTTASFTHNKWYECQESGWVEVLGASVSVFESQPELAQIGDDEVFATPDPTNVSFNQMIFNTLHPVGEVRVQYSSTDNPNNLWVSQGITCVWEDCTDEFEERYLMASSSESVGTEIDAGLPNIKGSSNYVLGTKNAANTGAIKLTNSSYDVITSAVGTGDTRNFTTLSFNASDSNSIYSDSVSTVRPKTYTVKYWRRVS